MRILNVLRTLVFGTNKQHVSAEEKHAHLVNVLAIAVSADSIKRPEELIECSLILSEQEGITVIEQDKLLQLVCTKTSEYLSHPKKLDADEIKYIEFIVNENQWNLALYLERVAFSDNELAKNEGRILVQLAPLLEARAKILNDIKQNKSKIGN